MNNQEFLKSITLDGEEWRDVIGFEGLYKVSSYGRVVSLERYPNNRYQNVYKQPHLLRASNTKGEKTPSVTLSKDSKQSKRHLPFLVAQNFLPQPDNNYVLDAKDGDFYNCKVDNLYWRRKSKHANFTIPLHLKVKYGRMYKDTKACTKYLLVEE